MLNLTPAIINAFHAPARTIDCLIKVTFPTAGIVTFGAEDYIVKVDLLEEEYHIDNSPYGRISSNELVVDLQNMNNRFSFDNITGPYYNQMLPDLKVELFYKINVYDPVLETFTFEEVPGGTYYTEKWQRSSDGSLVTIVAYDRMYKWKEIKLEPSHVLRNITVYDALVACFNAANIAGANYTLDVLLHNYTIPYFVWGDTLGSTLQQFITGYGCRIYFDRFDKLLIKKGKTSLTVLTMKEDDLIIGVTAPPDGTRAFSKVNLFYNKYEISPLKELLITSLEAGLNTVSFSASRVLLLTAFETKALIDSIKYNHKEVTLDSNIDTPLKILGQHLEQAQYNSSVTSAPLVIQIGSKELNMSSFIIQDSAEALAFAQSTLDEVVIQGQWLRIVNRGNLALELGDLVSVSDDQNAIYGLYHVTKMQHIYDGGLEAVYTLFKGGGI